MKNNVEVKDYFEYVKSKKQKSTNEELKFIYERTLELLSKYRATGQVEGMKRLVFILESVEKEMEIVERGYSTYIDKEDIQEYIETVEDRVVKIIEIERYERDIPCEIVDDMLEVKDLFDDFLIVFTDYTGEVERKVSKERRDKDPILFGVFYDPLTNDLLDRFYYIGDWEDEYCDLTLDKMVAAMSKEKKKNIKRDLLTDGEIARLKKEIYGNSAKNVNTAKNPTLLDKVKSLFKRG